MLLVFWMFDHKTVWYQKGYGTVTTLYPTGNRFVMALFYTFVIYTIGGASMKEEVLISDKKIAKLTKRIAKNFGISEEDALSLVYEEWELVESLFHAHKKVKAVAQHMTDEINFTYRIA